MNLGRNIWNNAIRYRRRSQWRNHEKKTLKESREESLNEFWESLKEIWKIYEEVSRDRNEGIPEEMSDRKLEEIFKRIPEENPERMLQKEPYAISWIISKRILDVIQAQISQGIPGAILCTITVLTQKIRAFCNRLSLTNTFVMNESIRYELPKCPFFANLLSSPTHVISHSDAELCHSMLDDQSVR